MIKNVGKIDRLFRFVAGLTLLFLSYIYFSSDMPVIGAIFILPAALFFYVAATSYCVACSWMGISTMSKSELKKFNKIK